MPMRTSIRFPFCGNSGSSNHLSQFSQMHHVHLLLCIENIVPREFRVETIDVMLVSNMKIDANGNINQHLRERHRKTTYNQTVSPKANKKEKGQRIDNSPVEDAMPERLPQARLVMIGESWGLDKKRNRQTNNFRRKNDW